MIDRELKNKQIISAEAVAKFYEENKAMFQEPAQAKVQHLLFPTREIPSGKPLPPSTNWASPGRISTVPLLSVSTRCAAVRMW